MRTIGIMCVCIAALCLSGAALALDSPIRVIYPRSYSDSDKRADYYVKLLELALSKSGANYDLRVSEFQMSSTRMRQQLESGDGMDVTWGPTSRSYEQTFQPIRITLDKGILGWRLFLIRHNEREAFARIQTLDQLRAYAAGQQSEWSDVGVLEANGLKVVTAVSYEWLFRMLAADRFQYFPRGVGEIWGEAQSNIGLGLEVEPHLALHYPANTYFFVRKNNTALARALERGLRAAIKDGSFDKLFDQYNGEAVKRAHLNTRTVFELKNPLLPEEKPLAADEHPLRR